MADFPDELDSSYIKDYKENFNKSGVARSNDLFLVSSSINMMKNYLLVFCVLVLVFAGVYLMFINSGKLTPVLNNQNNFSIQNDITSPNINVSFPNINVYIHLQNDTYYNVTNFNVNVSNFSNATV